MLPPSKHEHDFEKIQFYYSTTLIVKLANGCLSKVQIRSGQRSKTCHAYV